MFELQALQARAKRLERKADPLSVRMRRDGDPEAGEMGHRRTQEGDGVGRAFIRLHLGKARKRA